MSKRLNKSRQSSHNETCVMVSINANGVQSKTQKYLTITFFFIKDEVVYIMKTAKSEPN